MPGTKNIFIGPTVAPTQYGAATGYLVQTPGQVLYLVYCASGGAIQFCKSLDAGITWSTPVPLDATLSVGGGIAIWYDRWSNIAAGLIHVAYTVSDVDDTLYRTIDTENADALSTETVIFAGATTAGGGMLSITRAVGGNVYCRTCIDAGAEGGFYRLPNANVPGGAWDAARTDIEALATTDQAILLPDLNSADNQDIYGIFWDASADEISRVNYDDSANTWAETSISTGMVDVVATSSFPHFAAATDLTNSQHIVVAWTGVDTLNADLKCWTVNSTTITAKTDVVTNSTDDQGLCAVGIDTNTGYWHCWYAGKSDGSETWGTSVNIYKKVSTDSGTTWSSEIPVTVSANAPGLNDGVLLTIPRFNTAWAVAHTEVRASDVEYLWIACEGAAHRRAQVLLGV